MTGLGRLLPATNVPTAMLKGWQRLLEADIKLASSSRFTGYLLNFPQNMSLLQGQ